MSNVESSPASSTAIGNERLPLERSQEGVRTRYRWVVLTLVFFAITINYLDRLVMAVLAPDLQRIYSITDYQYGWIMSAFAFAYAIGQVVCGSLLDKIGVRAGYAISTALWSISSAVHGIARGAWGFGIARGALGVSESPAYPAATKTLAEWFPKKERAFAFGFVNAGCNMGAILAPVVVPKLAGENAEHWWHVFAFTGVIGFIWLAFWLALYRSPETHPKVNQAELDYIQSDPPEPKTKVPWLVLITYRQAWAFAIAKFLTDSMWWFYISWFPKFLHDNHGLNLMKIGFPLITIYVLADIGSVAGGWLSSIMMKTGLSLNASRKIAMLVPAVAILPVIFTQGIQTLWPAVMMLGLATACHQAFSSNLYTLVSDMFPKRAVGSIAGFGGMFGYIGASIFQPLVGYLVQEKHNYLIPFVCAGTAYLLALIAIHLLAPKLEPAKMDDPAEPRGFDVIKP